MAGPILLLFVDGVGLAPAAESNPLACGHTPRLERLLGGPLVIDAVQERPHLVLRALDATLGVPGLPQSATGQTTLFSGHNAAAALGRHVAAFPGPRLRGLLLEDSVLRRARRRGHRVTFANAFSPAYFEAIAARRLRHSATVLAAMAAGVALRGVAELRAGQAVTWDIERDRFTLPAPGAPWGAAGEPIERVTAHQAGEHLASLLHQWDLVLFETFLTDLAGHGRGLAAGEALRRLDGLLAGALDRAPAASTVVLTSDHGNLEAAGDTRHTRNPVPLLAIGPQAPRFAALSVLTEVADGLLAALEANRSV